MIARSIDPLLLFWGAVDMDGIILFVVVAFIAFFFLKYFSAESPAPGTDSEFSWVSRNIDQVIVMFPNADANAIAYDMSKTRSVEETIEKLLSGQTLPRPPIESRYYDFARSSASPSNPGTQNTANSNRAASMSSSSVNEPTKEDLIKKYNLQNRVYVNPESQSTGSTKYEWSKDRQQREQTLRKRKEDMILAARRKLVEQEGKTQA